MAAARSIRSTSSASFTTRRPSTTPWVATRRRGANTDSHARIPAQLTWAASRPTAPAPPAAAARASRWAATPPMTTATSSAAPDAASCSAAWVR